MPSNRHINNIDKILLEIEHNTLSIQVHNRIKEQIRLIILSAFRPRSYSSKRYLNKLDEINYSYLDPRSALKEFLKELHFFIEMREKTSDNDEPEDKLSELHPQIKAVSNRLFNNGHYTEAVLNAYKYIENAVKLKSGIASDINPTPLMEQVFSSKKPILKLSDNEDERQGFLFLFKGAVMAIRNPRAHQTDMLDTKKKALDLLCLASVLMGFIEVATIVEENKK